MSTSILIYKVLLALVQAQLSQSAYLTTEDIERLEDVRRDLERELN